MGTDTRSGVGRSRSGDSFTAGHEAATEALAAAAGGRPAFTIVYGTVLHDQDQLIAGVRSVIAEGPLVGGSTQGISTRGSVEEVERAVGVMVVCSEQVTARSVVVHDIGGDSHRAGQQIADALGEPSSVPLLLFYDPLVGTNVEALLDCLATRGYERILGGGAGQPFGPIHRTFQYEGRKAHSGSAVALRLEGPIELVYELTHGSEPLGLELTITASRDNVIETIDGRPALEVLLEQLGVDEIQDMQDIADWAVGVQPDAVNYEGPITRAIFGIDNETKSVVLQAPIAPDTTVQLCQRTKEAVVDRALKMAERMRDALAGRDPIGLLSFECGARPSPFLGNEAALDEVTRMQEILGSQIPWLGTYAWGELAPIGDRTYFHNYTFPLVALCEPKAGTASQ